MQRRIVQSILWGFLAGACASAPRPSSVRPILSAVVPPAPSLTGAPVTLAVVARPAAEPEPEPESEAPEQPPEVPPAPAKFELSGAAALIWVPDDKAPHRFTSVLATETNGKARIIAERKEPVLVGARELWVVRTKKLASLGCNDCDACHDDPPTCKQDAPIEIAEPYLKSLTTGRSFEPWKSAYSARGGCGETLATHDVELELHGGVGQYYFFTVHGSEQFCGGAHPMFSTESVTLDLDRKLVAELSFPQVPTPLLRKRAQLELAAGCVLDAKEEPVDYRVLASYSPKGELEGSFQFTMSAPYMCGTGPGHYSALSEQISDWIPPELERWGKLPGWVAELLASKNARHAFMIGAARSRTVARELKRR